MNLAVDHQHRSGLGGDTNVRPRGGKRFRLEHADAAIAIDMEDTVGRHEEIALPLAAVEWRNLDVFLDMKADRRKVLVIHSGIHRECEGYVARESFQAPIGLSVWVAQMEGDVVAADVDLADDVVDTLESQITTIFRQL
jgi:hypothetical protein